MSQEPSEAPPLSLEDARAAIDAVDDRLLALIAERATLSMGIAAAKSAAPLASPLRPAREVAILRRLIAGAPDRTDPALVVEIWRALIADNLRRQKCVEVFVGGALDPVRLFDMARRHFGSGARIARQEDARTTLARMVDTPAAAAVLPFPSKSGAGGWWPILAESRFRDAAIVAALPLRGDAEPEGAVVTVGAPLEKAGGDHSLVLAFDPHHKIGRALNEAHLKGMEVARVNATVLIRFDEFMGVDDPRLVPMARAGLDGPRVVGVYARV